MISRQWRGLAIALAIVAGLANAEAPRRPKSTHPIIGTWAFMVPDTDCEETYYMRRDGTSLVTSGEEVSESIYQIDDEPSAKGFYKSTDKLVKDNGKMDCSGEVMKVGNEVTNYIRFHPSGDMIIICRDESLDACFGPLHRVQGQDSFYIESGRVSVRLTGEGYRKSDTMDYWEAIP